MEDDLYFHSYFAHTLLLFLGKTPYVLFLTLQVGADTSFMPSLLQIKWTLDLLKGLLKGIVTNIIHKNLVKSSLPNIDGEKEFFYVLQSPNSCINVKFPNQALGDYFLAHMRTSSVYTPSLFFPVQQIQAVTPFWPYQGHYEGRRSWCLTDAKSSDVLLQRK